ncbi:MAG: permease [Myxococcota bacterium]|nr:permease [Myxococcota bacterium]
MLLLTGSCLALMVGPLLLRFAGPRPALVATLDGFVLVTVLGLVFLHIFPEAVAVAGSSALIAAVVGILLPLLLEKVASQPVKTKTVRPILLLLALSALAVHGLMDGAALIQHGALHGEELGSDAALGLGVLLHRLPLGLAVWWMVCSTFGSRVATCILAGLMVVTCVGYFAGAALVASLSFEGVTIFQALMGGTILHVALDEPPSLSEGLSSDRASLSHFGFFGAFFGCLVVWGIGQLQAPGPVEPNGLEGVDIFTTLSLQAAPALLTAFIGAGLLHGFAKQDWIAFLKKGNRFSQSVKGVAVGIPLPICSCGVLPFYRSLIQRGVPPAAGIGFLIATPELGIDAIILSVPLLGGELTVVRVVVATAIAILSGWLLSRFFDGKLEKESMNDPAPASEVAPSFQEKLKKSFDFGFVEYVDDILPWVFLGICIGAVAEPVMDLAAFQEIPDALEVPLAALVGIPVYVCASGATPLGAVLLHRGLSAGALIAFLMTGPATNISTFGVLRSMHSSRAAWAMALGVFGFSVGFGLLVNLMIDDNTSGELAMMAHEHAEWWEWLALGAMGLLLLGCLWRMGPRGFVASVVPGMPGSVQPVLGEHGHFDDAHGHCHEESEDGTLAPVVQPVSACCTKPDP